MIPSDTRRGASVDVGQVLDTGPWSMVQKMAVVLAALSIVLDGFDSQLIGFAIPGMSKEGGVTRGEFAPALAAGLFGMGLGSVLAGYFADRFGRRMALIGSVFLLGFATCAIGASQNVPMIAVLRFIAGLGIGGCLPSASTVAAEFTPIRVGPWR
jgi:MFS transporter, AAHS family, 4-hydroxybenzoate transporter